MIFGFFVFVLQHDFDRLRLLFVRVWHSISLLLLVLDVDVVVVVVLQNVGEVKNILREVFQFLNVFLAL